jgi:threonine/homoserine/homoserine lactone efflux protein
MALLLSVFGGILFGLALAAPPGPMNAIIAEESVVRGWHAGTIAGLGAMTADVIFFVLALLGVATVVERFPLVQGGMVAVGGLLMLYFAVDAARSAQTTLTGSDVPEDSRGFQKTFVLALTNPYQILFWLTVGVALLNPGTVDVLSHTPFLGDALAGFVVVKTGSVALLGGFFGGIAIWIVGFPGVLAITDEKIDTLSPVVAAGSAIILVGFGVFFLWDGVGTLLESV